MKLLRQYLKGIVIILAMAVFGAIFYFGGNNETSQITQKSESSSAESDSTSEEVRAAVTQMTDLQKKIESLQEQLAAQAIEDEQLQKLTEERISAVQEKIDQATDSEAVPEPVAHLLSDIGERLESIENRVATGPQSTIPDYEIEGAQPGLSGHEILWIDSATGVTDLPAPPELIDFAEQLGTQASGSEPEPDPVYTLPPTTIVDATALTALVGRLPVDGHIDSPWRFKLLSKASNFTSRSHRVPGLKGVIWSGVAYGDLTLSCVSATVDTVTYVYDDGVVHTQKSPSNPDDITSGIGWLSDDRGNPCIPGDLKTNAPAVIARGVTTGTLSGIARGYAEAQTTRQSSSEGATTTTITGDAEDYALANAAADAVDEANAWFRRRLGQSFDAIYVPAGRPVIIHIEQQVNLDRPADLRRLVHSENLPQFGQNHALGLHD